MNGYEYVNWIAYKPYTNKIYVNELVGDVYHVVLKSKYQ